MIRLLVISLLLFNCSHDSDHENLDVPIDKKTNTESSEPTELEWQSYFKPPPSPSEFLNLKKKLISWPSPQSPGEMLAKARAQSVVGELKAAEATYRALLRSEGEHLLGHIELAQIYLKMKDLNRSFSYLVRAKEIIDETENPRTDLVIQYKYTLALAYIERSDFQKANKILAELIAIDSSFTPGYAAMASSYLRQNKEKAAEFVAKRGLDRGQEDPRLTNLLGVLEKERGQLVAARRWFDRALNQSPNFVPALVNRATIALSSGEYESTRLDLEKAISLQPTHVEAHIVLGILQRRTGEFKASEASFNRAIDLDPENAYARYNLGVLKSESLNQKSEALRLFTEVLQIDSKDPTLQERARLSIDSLKRSHASP